MLLLNALAWGLGLLAFALTSAALGVLIGNVIVALRGMLQRVKKMQTSCKRGAAPKSSVRERYDESGRPNPR
jgi:hypothetical protein